MWWDACVSFSPLPLPVYFSFFAIVSIFSTNSRGNVCHAGQWCLLWRLDVKSHSVAVTEGHSLLDTMFSSRIACHRTQYFKLLSLHWRSQSTESRLFDRVRAFEDIPEPNGWKLMYDLFTKTEHFSKGTNFLSAFSKNLDLFTKRAWCWVPKPLYMLSNQKISRKFSVRKENIRGGCS